MLFRKTEGAEIPQDVNVFVFFGWKKYHGLPMHFRRGGGEILLITTAFHEGGRKINITDPQCFSGEKGGEKPQKLFRGEVPSPGTYTNG